MVNRCFYAQNRQILTKNGSKKYFFAKKVQKVLTFFFRAYTKDLRYWITIKRIMSTEKIPYKKLKPNNVANEVWKTVVEAWENGLSDREAALMASRNSDEMIKASDIAMWKKKNPEIAELQAFLEVSLRADAKLNIKDAIKAGKTKVSQWYLERKAADEFSTKSAVAFEGAVVELSLEEKEKALKELVETFGHGE